MMRSLHILIAVLALGHVVAAPPVSGPASAPEDGSWDAIHPIFPSPTEGRAYWRDATALIDKFYAREWVQISCGRNESIYGGYAVLCVRMERRFRIIQEAYFAARARANPILREEKDRVVVVLPSGVVLLEWKRTPD